MLKTELIDTLGIQEDNFLMLPTVSDDFDKACKLFQQEIESRGGIDLLILGLGENGHLGFNQPGSPLGTGRMYPTGNEYTAGERTGWCYFGNPEHHAGP